MYPALQIAGSSEDAMIIFPRRGTTIEHRKIAVGRAISLLLRNDRNMQNMIITVRTDSSIKNVRFMANQPAAPGPERKVCGQQDLNLHGCPLEPKSSASANSAMTA